MKIDVDKLAKKRTRRNPALDGVPGLARGLEVLEYSAAAMIAAKDIGEVVYITEDEVKAIEEAFHLD